MSRRVTVTLDEDIVRKLRMKQAMDIKKSAKHVSFSKIVNSMLEKSF